MRTTQWDEEFLSRRERDAEQAAFRQQCDGDREQAARQLQRERSDVLGCHTQCRHASCRRARRCMADGVICWPLQRYVTPPAVMQSMLDEIYGEIQEERRDAAQEP
jgi:hypothetical protein